MKACERAEFQNGTRVAWCSFRRSAIIEPPGHSEGHERRDSELYGQVGLEIRSYCQDARFRGHPSRPGAPLLPPKCFFWLRGITQKGPRHRVWRSARGVVIRQQPRRIGVLPTAPLASLSLRLPHYSRLAECLQHQQAPHLPNLQMATIRTEMQPVSQIHKGPRLLTTRNASRMFKRHTVFCESTMITNIPTLKQVGVNTPTGTVGPAECRF